MSIAQMRPFADEHQDFGISDRVPPQDVAAEQSVLGAMMLSKDAISDVTAILKPQDFYRPAHEQVYEAIIDLDSRNEPADAITVADELAKRGQIGKIGGHMYLHELLETVSIASNAGYYAEIVHEKAVLRRLVEASTRIAQLGYAGRGDVSDIVDEAQQVIFKVVDGEDREEVQPLADLIGETLDEMEQLTKHDERAGVPTGFAEFDDLTNGLHPGQMVIIAARPAMGKSTLALDFARAAAIKHEQTTAFFSLEMSKSEIVMKLISAETGIKLEAIRKGMIDDNHWARIAQKTGVISSAPLYIDDSPNLTIMDIRSKARRLKQTHDLKLVIVDYLQLMTSGKRVESRQVEVAEFSRQMKLLAKELQVPVVALSQLNRGSEQTKDKKPMLSHLRESGSLEQDADLVVLLHREDMYDQGVRPGEADLIVAKHRNGPTRTITVSFQGHFSRFTDMARGFGASARESTPNGASRN
ncbi:MAG: replicative DNA helicase [Propionibacteriaceae bacterium]|jgi:replicative DNA helicase|nr:replicative DNA helicase [Propionibacteriaceae bacterium]